MLPDSPRTAQFLAKLGIADLHDLWAADENQTLMYLNRAIGLHLGNINDATRQREAALKKLVKAAEDLLAEKHWDTMWTTAHAAEAAKADVTITQAAAAVQELIGIRQHLMLVRDTAS